MALAATLLFPICNLNSIHSSGNQVSECALSSARGALYNLKRRSKGEPSERGSLCAVAATKGSAKQSESEETIPTWARPDSEEPPPWARGEAGESQLNQGMEVPFYAYLLASAVIAIAAIGSAFEYVNQKPIFGIVRSDSVLYAPLLGFFVFTGIPTAAFLWFKSVQVANKEAEEQDRRDGFL